MEDITYADYPHTKRVCKDLGEYHDLYVQSNTLLVNVFESFRNMHFKIYEIFFQLLDSRGKQSFKKTNITLDLLTGIY